MSSTEEEMKYWSGALAFNLWLLRISRFLHAHAFSSLGSFVHNLFYLPSSLSFLLPLVALVR